MPLEFRTVTVLLRGVAQNFADKTRPPELLTEAVNVEFDRDGELNKRRGYQYCDPTEAVNLDWPTDTVMAHLARRRHELLVVTYDHVAAVGSKDGSLRGSDAVVYRGPNNRGHVKLRTIAVSQAAGAADDLEALDE